MTPAEKQAFLELVTRVVNADLLTTTHVNIILAICENAIDAAIEREKGCHA